MVGWFSAALIGAFRSLLFHSVICSLGGLLSHGSPVVVFFDRGHRRYSFFKVYTSPFFFKSFAGSLGCFVVVVVFWGGWYHFYSVLNPLFCIELKQHAVQA